MEVILCGGLVLFLFCDIMAKWFCRKTYWLKCSHFLCLSFTEMIMGSLVTFDSPGLNPVFET